MNETEMTKKISVQRSSLFICLHEALKYINIRIINWIHAQKFLSFHFEA